MPATETCPICEKHYTKRNPKVNAHLKYEEPEETEYTCENCNRAEYYYRHPEKLKNKSWFWKWWWNKRINLVMEYYRDNRAMLKTFYTSPDVPMKKILFYPVTCNPPHVGHISAVNTAIRSIDFDEIWIMPSGKRVDKEIATHTEDRKELGKILVECVQKGTNIPVKLVSTAIDNIDTKYSHDVIVELKSNSEDDIYQLAGTDGFTSIKERVIGPNEKFIIIKRSGYEFPENLVLNKNLIILNEEATVAGISSTKIREMVKNRDMEYKKLVPKEISKYIEEKGLYL